MFINSFEILEDLEMIFTIEHTPAPCTSSKELLPSAGHTVAGITYYSFLNSFFCCCQAWSITYHSWLTFVLLLWACLIWITPFARWFCMVSSPGLVIYAELLLLVQYVYGLQLTDDELPLQDPTGTFDYSELGLKKWQFPCLHLGAQVQQAHTCTEVVKISQQLPQQNKLAT